MYTCVYARAYFFISHPAIEAPKFSEETIVQLNKHELIAIGYERHRIIYLWEI